MERIIIEFLKQLNIAIKNYHFDTRESIKFETLFEIRKPLLRVLGGMVTEELFRCPAGRSPVFLKYFEIQG